MTPPPSKLSGARPAIPRDGVVRLFRDRGGRNGKTVTVIHGLPERGPALEARLSELKRMCGAGGTLRDGVIEIQGDHRDLLVAELAKSGWTVKRSGG